MWPLPTQTNKQTNKLKVKVNFYAVSMRPRMRYIPCRGVRPLLEKKKGILCITQDCIWICFVYLLLMVYQLLWVIWWQSHPCKGTAMILSNPYLSQGYQSNWSLNSLTLKTQSSTWTITPRGLLLRFWRYWECGVPFISIINRFTSTQSGKIC